MLQLLKAQNAEIKSQMEVIHNINVQLESKVNEIKDSSVTLESHWNTLLELSKNRTISLGHLDKALPHILKVAAKSLGINRVGIWTYHQEPEQIECLLVYDEPGDSFSSGTVLLRETNDTYFQSIRRQRIMAVSDARTHEDTRDFTDTYMKPLEIHSMMDAPFFIDGELKGILCCEHTSERRHWSCEDIIFATALADIITIAYRCSMRNDYEKRIREMNRKVSTTNEQLLHKTEEIERANQLLEERVTERTKALTLQNKHLAEYAFINSHVLRGPVARVMGLVDVLEMETSPDSAREIMSRLRETANELDEVVKKINVAIEKGSHFGRDNF
jgi:GAF domain-containing protein